MTSSNRLANKCSEKYSQHSDFSFPGYYRGSLGESGEFTIQRDENSIGLHIGLCEEWLKVLHKGHPGDQRESVDRM
jgi:hypothetical protein